MTVQILRVGVSSYMISEDLAGQGIDSTSHRQIGEEVPQLLEP